MYVIYTNTMDLAMEPYQPKFSSTGTYGDIRKFVERCFTIESDKIGTVTPRMNEWWHLHSVKLLKNKINYDGLFSDPYHSEFIGKTWKSFLIKDPLFETLRVTQVQFNQIPEGTKIHAYGTIEELNKYTKLNSLKVLNYFPDKEYTYNKDFQPLQTAGCMVCS